MDLDLYRWMMNLETVFEFRNHPIEKGIVGLREIHYNMCSQCGIGGTQSPNMKVVYRNYTFLRQQEFPYCPGVDIFWASIDCKV